MSDLKTGFILNETGSHWKILRRGGHINVNDLHFKEIAFT